MKLPPNTIKSYRHLHAEGVIDELLLLFIDAVWREVCEVEDERYRTSSEALTALKARLLEATHNVPHFTKKIFPRPPKPRKPKRGEQMRLL